MVGTFVDRTIYTILGQRRLPIVFNDPIEWCSDDPEIGRYQYRYDPRLVWIEDRYWVTWCNGFVYSFGAAGFHNGHGLQD